MIAVVVIGLCGCASNPRPGKLPAGEIDPTTGVVKPDNGSIPFYPGNIELRSVPSMPRVPKRNPSTVMALWTEELIGRPGAHLYARNDTDKPMRVAKVSVYECENIEGGCLDYDPNLVLRPGEKQRLYTVVPLQREKAYRYRWRAWGGEERVAAPSVTPMPASNIPHPVTRVPPSQPPPPTSRTNSNTSPPPGVDLSGAVSNAKGNPLDTEGATITMTAYAPGDRSVRSLPPAAMFHGRRMRLSADIDARQVLGAVTLWVQADAPGGNVTAESSDATHVSGTKRAHISVTMSIPRDATKLTLGLKLNGTGEVVATAFKFREVLPSPRKLE